MSPDLRRYLDQSRLLSVSLVAALPLLAIYEIGLLATRSPVENHAGLLVKRMIGLFGTHVYLVLTGLVAATFLAALVKKRTGPARRFHLYWLMLFEGALYAAVLGPVVILTQRAFLALAAPDAVTGQRVLLLLGAGVWEELVFRLGLLGGLTWVAVDVLRGKRAVFAPLLLVATSAAFSLFHHVGSMGEPFTVGAFLFRFLAGFLLGGIYLLRGLGVGVYTHAFYNVGLLLWTAAT